MYILCYSHKKAAFLSDFTFCMPVAIVMYTSTCHAMPCLPARHPHDKRAQKVLTASLSATNKKKRHHTHAYVKFSRVFICMAEWRIWDVVCFFYSYTSSRIPYRIYLTSTYKRIVNTRESSLSPTPSPQ